METTRTVTFECPAERQADLIRDLIQRKRGALHLFRPLSRAEREAWRRWHRDMETYEMLRIRRASGVFPLIYGGVV